MGDRQRADTDHRALRDRVYEQILGMLLEGRVEPGQRLSIDTLARTLQVSPTPVREAMVHLESTGLVSREALKGYRVAPPLDRDRLLELFDARLMLETAAAQQASRDARATAASLATAHERHRDVAERVVAAHESGERVPVGLTQEYFRADAGFHAAMFEHAGNRYIAEMYAQLDALTHRMRQAVHTGPADVREAVAEHSAILRAFAEGTPGEIVDAVAEHIHRVRDRALGELEGE